MSKPHLDANGLQCCARCGRKLAPDGQGDSLCACPDRDRSLRMALQTRAAGRQMGLPGIATPEGPPASWWRDYGK